MATEQDSYDWVDDELTIDATVARLNELEAAPVLVLGDTVVMTVVEASMTSGGVAELWIERPFKESRTVSGTIIS